MKKPKRVLQLLKLSLSSGHIANSMWRSVPGLTPLIGATSSKPNCQLISLNGLKEIPKLMSESHKKMIDLNVPIKVDFGMGDTWDDAH